MEKRLQVKIGSITRYLKEVHSYEKELVSQKEKIAQYRAEGREEYDIKQQIEVLNETEQVLPDTIRRLSVALEDLKAFVNDSEGQIDVSPAQEDVIKQAEDYLKDKETDN